MKKQKVKNARKSRSRAWILITILASAAILAVVVGTIVSSRTAEAQQEISRQPQASDDDATIEFASQRITIDAQTGRLRKPTVEEARALVDTLTGLTNRSGKGLKVERGHDGVRQVDLKGRFQTVVLAKPNPDGTNEIRCVSTMKEAADFLGLDPSKIPASKEAPNAK